MNEQIKQIKIETLNKLKQQKQAVENQRETLLQKKFGERKVLIDQECIKLDNALARYKQEKLAVYNDEIAKKQAEVQDKKAKLVENAKTETESEVNNEIALLTAEYVSEIAKLEKELGE